MPSLSKKARQIRALKDLEATDLAKAVKRRLADQCLTCDPGEVTMLRIRASLTDDFLAELRQLVTEGELKYND
jgi:hypothetical protein